MTSRKTDPSPSKSTDPAVTSPERMEPSEKIKDKPPKYDINFPIVGIGASAGGLAAIEAFFSGMPGDMEPGMAFLLVQHLAPDHKSILTELIQRYTPMQVFEVTDGMEVKPNCAYIIPPNRDMAFINGALQLITPAAPRGQRLPIDFLFRSLARDLRHRAICIVLSGTGSDGTQGLRAIKGEGGMVMAQTPDSTEYDGMPRSAIATGLVDYQLTPREMPAQLMAYVDQALTRTLPATSVALPKIENALKKIFVLLRVQVGHDFSQYKPNTILRRIQRRMAVHQIESMDAYVKFIHQTPAETEALFRDLLIGVTAFFRDKEAFKAIADRAIPQLFKEKPTGSTIRVWCPGCSTGEEAYSLAILLAQAQQTLKQHFKVQVFATDIDSQAITTARNGTYAASITADIPPELLDHYFSSEYDGTLFRINKTIRDMLVFSEQDVIKDPPFSKLDMISCRNLLIYMNSELQRKLIPLFHYALNPHGFLFLGTSETVGEFNELFSSVSRKMKLYQRKNQGTPIHHPSQQRFVPPAPLKTATLTAAMKKEDGVTLPLRELTEQALLQLMAPAAALVEGKGNILYLYGRTGMFLEPAPGEAGINNILKMARQGLQQPLTMALHKAVTDKEKVVCPHLRVKTNGDYTIATVTVFPLAAVHLPPNGTALFLVVLEKGAAVIPETKPDNDPVDGTADPLDREGEKEKCIAGLRQELKAREEYLQATTEELETSNEELKSSNEEMQSMNEELQSTNEELETSKEELQSVNEELSTVNTELQNKVAELLRVNNDMNNLLAGTGIATVFVDHHLAILRFTPTATGIINLIPSDVGRPLAHVVSNLTGYDRLVADVQSVLDTLVSREVAVETEAGKRYSLHIKPYRTLDNVIEGAVLTFMEIYDVKPPPPSPLQRRSPGPAIPDPEKKSQAESSHHCPETRGEKE